VKNVCKMCGYNTFDIMPIAMLSAKNYKLFFKIMEDAIPIYQGRDREPDEAAIIKVI
jgi:hypothetical protein